MNVFFRQFRNGELFPWERDFTKELLGVAIPIAIQSAFMALLHIIDNIMIGRLGEIELAAVTQANRVTFLFELVLFGLSGGTAAYVAQFWGKRDLKSIHSVMGLSIGLSVFSALLFLVPCTLMPQVIMRLLLKEEAAVSTAAEYLPVIAVGYVFMALATCFTTVQKSTEQTRLPMAGGIAALLTNTFLNYCLIFGNFGFPRLGVRGGAIATVIATVAELLIVVAFGYRFRFATAARLSDLIPRSISFLKKYLAVVAPVILNEGLWSLGMVMYSYVYGRMGIGTVAAVSIFTSVEQVAIAGIRGLVSGAAVLIGKRIGAGDENGAYNIARRLLYATFPTGIVSGLILLLVSIPMTGLFNVSEQVLSDAQTLVRICAATIWLNQLGGLLIVGILRAGGDVNMSLFLDAGTIWIIGVPLVALGGLVLGLPIPYVFLLTRVEALVKVLLGLWRFKSRKWIHNLVR